MLLPFGENLINPDHVAHVEPFTPGGPMRLTIVLSSGTRMSLPLGEQADAFYKQLRGYHTNALTFKTPGVAPCAPAGEKGKGRR